MLKVGLLEKDFQKQQNWENYTHSVEKWKIYSHQKYSSN